MQLTVRACNSSLFFFSAHSQRPTLCALRPHQVQQEDDALLRTRVHRGASARRPQWRWSKVTRVAPEVLSYDAVVLYLSLSSAAHPTEIAEWKFASLDQNSDDQLTLDEFRVLNRIVRKRVKPLKCAKRFPQYCDDNRDDSITRSEWTSCLGQYAFTNFKQSKFCSSDTVAQIKITHIFLLNLFL